MTIQADPLRIPRPSVYMFHPPSINGYAHVQSTEPSVKYSVLAAVGM